MRGSRSHEFGRLVQQAGGDVMVIVKDQTPVTRADLDLFFEDSQADKGTWQSYTRRERAWPSRTAHDSPQS